MQTETKYDITRDFTDFFDEAVGMGLSQEIRSCSDRYDAGDQLAAGGMKRIIVTQDNITGREVAKAVMKDSGDPVKVERFFHEARICASLEHPNIVPVYDIGYDSDEQPFFTMKLIHGQTLKDLINKKEAARTDLMVIFLKICDAMAYSHSRGVIHRDLKPDNIQISSFGEVLVCDWGLSRREDSDEEDLDDAFDSPSAPVTVDGIIKGTPGYMSPEQARGEKNAGQASDIYSLGALLYFILAGKPPLHDESLNDAIVKTGKGEVPRLQKIVPDIPAPLCAICHKAMSFQPGERYESPVDLKNDVFKFIHGYATSVENIGMIGLFRLMMARNRRISLIIVTSLIIILSLISWFIISLNLSRSEALSAKKVAETALVKFKDAEETKHKLTKDAAPRILERVHRALFTYDFEKALEICNYAIDLDYTLAQAHSQKGYVLLSLLRFEDALQEFRIAGFKENQKAVKATIELSAHFNENRPQNLEDFIHVVETYQEYNMKQMIREQIFSPTMNNLTADDRRKFAGTVLKIQNKDLGPVFFDHNQVSLNWERLRDASGLYKTGITILNLKHSLPESLLVLKDLPVTELVWPKSMGSKYKVADLLPYVMKCNTLQEISIPLKVFNKPQLEKLQSKMKVTFY